MKAKQRKALYLKLAEGFANNTIQTHGICNVLRKKIKADTWYGWVNEVLNQFDEVRLFSHNSYDEYDTNESFFNMYHADRATAYGGGINRYHYKNNPLRATIMLLAAAMID